MVTENILIEARKYFETYYQSVKTQDELIQKGIDLKKNHTSRVVEISNKLAKSLELSPEQSSAAEIIALFHDIGRFAQITQYETFNDEQSEDHAELSAKVLSEADFFDKINEETQKVILNAIRQHNKIKLPKHSEEHDELLAKLIRDADKIDVLGLFANQFNSKTNSEELNMMVYDLPNKNSVSEKVIKSILQEKAVKKEDMKTQNDFKLMLMSWVFDLNFKSSFNHLNEKRYMEKIYNTLPKQDGIIDAYRSIKLFIENKFVK